MNIVIYKDKAEDWRWQMIADNGQVVADSAEGYENLSDMSAILDTLFGDRIERRFEGLTEL